MTDLIEREVALALCDRYPYVEGVKVALADLPAVELDQITYLRGWNDAMKSIKARVIDDPALSPNPVDASQTPDPVANDPRVKALVEAVAGMERESRKFLRTADFHAETCTCYRCNEDRAYAALRAIGGAE